MAAVCHAGFFRGYLMGKKFEIFMIVCLLTASFFLARKGASILAASDAVAKTGCIAIDAGHGGNDPGKIGVDGILEKDVNLALSLRLSALYKNRSFSVTMTRTKDTNLAGDADGSKKREDMKQRVALINSSDALCAISIHQNSYPDASVSGPQVFYYSGSAEGKRLAQCLQNSLNDCLAPARPRSVKANDDYYLLKNISAPTVIIECGFLSNPTEAANLTDAVYQDRVVRAIYLGTMDFLSQNSYS